MIAKRPLWAWRSSDEKSLIAVPAWVKIGLLFTLLGQLTVHAWFGQQAAQAEAMPEPQPVAIYRLLSLDEPLAMARYLDLWLQSFDTQAGISLSFRELDYPRLVRWLERILQLDRHSQYPLLVASHIYGSVQDPGRQRIMLSFVYQQFQQQPQRYWRWLAHAVIVAKHELHDMPLALKYASALAQASSPGIPYWAKDLKIIVLEDMGELQAARILLGGLLANKTITDEHEIRFLTERLANLEQKLMSIRQDVEISTDRRP